jgi:hypothetical protein
MFGIFNDKGIMKNWDGFEFKIYEWDKIIGTK